MEPAERALQLYDFLRQFVIDFDTIYLPIMLAPGISDVDGPVFNF